MWFNTVWLVIKHEPSNWFATLWLHQDDVIESYLLDEAITSENHDKINIGTKWGSTLIINDAMVFDEQKLYILAQKYEILAFMVSDITSSYYLWHFNQWKCLREYAVSEGEIKTDTWNILPWEWTTAEQREYNAGSDNIFEIIDNFSGICLNGDDLCKMNMDVYSQFRIQKKDGSSKVVGNYRGHQLQGILQIFICLLVFIIIAFIVTLITN